jgi:hypothetical protein
MPSLIDLRHALVDNPVLARVLGHDPLTPVPSVERFSSFLKSTPNSLLQGIRILLIARLLAHHVITADHLGLDSCPIPSRVKENNPKATGKDRFVKDRYPKGDREARLGVRADFSGKAKKVSFFWGYRNHVLTDLDTELPLWESTQPAHVQDNAMAIPVLQQATQHFHLTVKAVIADSAYDVEATLRFILHQLHAQPVIAVNPRARRDPNFQVRANRVFCPAKLSMFCRGKSHNKRTSITYRQYSCPLHYDRSCRGQFLICPANHPKFFSQKGCNYLVRLTPTVRSQIDYGSQQFKTLYSMRTGAERVFGRLANICMENLFTRGLNSTANQCTIAHIAVLLVANAAYEDGHHDKIAFVRSFVPRFLT